MKTPVSRLYWMATYEKPTIGPRPPWAKALIVAEYEKDESDLMTDYHATKRTVTVPLAWSSHDRDLFPEMRKAAALFGPTCHLGPGRDVWTARVVLSVPSPGYFVYNGTAWHDGDYDHNADRAPREFETKTEAEAFVAAHPPLAPCYFGDNLVSYRWLLTCGKVEHREKYSMGAGYYLKAGGRYSSGWRVSKTSYRLDDKVAA